VCVCPCVFYVSRVCLSAVLYVFIQCWVIYISKVYKYKILFKRIWNARQSICSSW